MKTMSKDLSTTIAMASAEVRLEKGITLKQQIENLSTTLIDCDHRYKMYEIEIDIDPMGEVHNTMRVVPMPGDLGSQNGFYKLQKNCLVKDGNRFIRIDDFTKTILCIRFTKEEYIRLYSLNGVMIHYDGPRTKGYRIGNDGMLFEIETDVESKYNIKDLMHKDACTNQITYKRGWRRYGYFGSTPAGTRGRKALFIDTKLNWGESEIELNKNTLGAYNLVKDKVVNIKGLIKIAARMFQWKAPSCSWGKVKDYAVLNGTFREMANDGMGYIRGIKIAKELSRILNIEVSLKAVIGLFIQNRPAMAKEASLIVSDEFISTLLDNYTVIRFTHAEMTPELSAKVFDPNGKFKGCMIVVSDNLNAIPEVIMDKNGLKMDFDYSSDLDLRVLAMAKPSRGRTSMQMLQKAYAADKTLTSEFVVNKYRNQLFDEIGRVLIEKQLSVPTFKDMTNLYAPNVLKKIAPKVILNDKSLFRDVIDGVIKSNTKKINKFNIDVDSYNLGIIIDQIYILTGIHILAPNEVYAPSLERSFKQSDRDYSKYNATLFKYPTIHLGEFLNVKVITRRQIVNRILQLNISDAVKDVVIDFVCSLSSGVIMVGAYEIIKRKLAGFDTDFDELVAVIEEGLCDIYWKSKLRNYVVYMVDEPKSSKASSSETKEIADKLNRNLCKEEEKKFRVSFPNFIYAFIAQQENGNTGIGKITNDDHSQIGLLEDLNEARKCFLDTFGNEGLADEYIGLPTTEESVNGITFTKVSVSKHLADEAIAEMAKCRFSDENLEHMILDINAIYRMYQEKTIDSPKTGEKVPVNINVCKNEKAASLSYTKIELDPQDRKKITLSTYEGMSPVFEDSISKDKQKCFQVFKEYMEECILPYEVKVSHDDVSFYSAFGKFASLVKSFTSIKYTYGNVVNAKINDRNEETSSETFRERKEILASMMRTMSEDVTPAVRAGIAKWVALTGKDGVKQDGGSNMTQSLLQEEYILMLLDKKVMHVDEFNNVTEESAVGIDFCGDEIYPQNAYNDGDEVEFFHGVADECIIKTDISGKLTIREYNGVLYASKLIKDMIVIPKTVNKVIIPLKHGSYTMKEIAEQLTVNTISVNADKRFGYGIFDKNGTKISGIDGAGKDLLQLFDGIIGQVVDVFYTKRGRDVNVFATVEIKERIERPVFSQSIPSDAFTEIPQMDCTYQEESTAITENEQSLFENMPAM